MAYDNANTYETIELFGMTEKDANFQFVGCSIVHLRRTAASTGRTAATDTPI